MEKAQVNSQIVKGRLTKKDVEALLGQTENVTITKDGGKTSVDKELKPTAKKLWDGFFGTNHSADNKGVGNTVANSMDDASDVSSGRDNSKTNNGIDGKTEHSDSFGKNTTGSSPSNNHNSTTYPNTPQGNLQKAQENLAELKNMAPSNHAKNALKVMAGTSVNPESAEFKTFASKVDNNIPINAKDLKSVGLNTLDVQKAGFSMNYDKNKFGNVDVEESGEHCEAGTL